jgi:homoserine kinase
MNKIFNPQITDICDWDVDSDVPGSSIVIDRGGLLGININACSDDYRAINAVPEILLVLKAARKVLSATCTFTDQQDALDELELMIKNLDQKHGF